MDFANIRRNAKNLKITEIPINRVKFFKVRTREENGFNDLRKSIEESGLKYPIGVRKIKNNKLMDFEYDYECVKGHGRLIACSSLGWKSIPAIIYDINDPEAVMLYLLENENRNKLPPVDIARLMKIEAEQGMSQDEIARRFHLSPTTVREYINFTSSATPETVKMIREEKVTFEDGIKLSRLSTEEQKEAISAISSSASNKKEASIIVSNVRQIRKRTNSPITASKVRYALSELRVEVKTKNQLFSEYSYYWRISYLALKNLLKNKKIRKLLKKHNIDYSLIEQGDKINA